VLTRWLKIGGLVVFVVVGGTALLVASRWPFTRDSVVKALQEKFSSTVEFKSFHETYLTPGCVIEGVTFRRNNDRNARPIATVGKITIQGSYRGFFTSQKRVQRVRVEGLRIFVSPQSERNDNEARPAVSLDDFALLINEIIADGAVVEFATDEPGTKSHKFEIHKLTLNEVADDRPMTFHATLQNPEPPGEIQADGQFGPLQAEHVGRTFVSGSYTFQRADLAVFPGIAGTLASTGKFHGVLKEIEVEGNTDVPDFRVTRSNHAIHLKAEFHAMVDGVEGDVALESVRAHFGQSSVVLHGEVRQKAGSEEKTVTLEATQLQGRIEDWLHLLSKEERPALTGPMKFRAQIQVPPGDGNFIERINAQGEFGIAAMKFTHSTQGKVDTLSQVAQGEKENDEPASVVGTLKGKVELKDAIATFSELTFEIPGALAHAHGTFGLLTEKIDVHGTLQVENKLSKGSTGMKSFLLKFVEPFLKKKNAGEIVPIKIGGSFSHPTYGLDISP
jgi:hypothetical protein